MGFDAFSVDRRTVLRSAAGFSLGAGLLSASTSTVTAASGGPVVLMGIDAEDGGVGGHGDISIYVDVVNDILSRVGNGGSGILVIGGEHDGGFGDVTEFWDAIGSHTGESITYVRGATNIQNQSFSGYAMLAVVSSYPETWDGMSQAENDALVSRSGDVASFVDNGGGLFGSSQDDFTNSWAYISDIGSFSTNTGLSYSDVTPTTAGNNIGIHDPDLDLCCWHDTFEAWPGFLDVLAWRAGYEDQQAAALGGASVTFQAPNAQCSASFPEDEPCVSDDITFDASDSTDPDGDDAALTYEWDFGDGNTATGATVTHSYDSEGTKNVVVTVTDVDGKSSTCELTLDVVTCAIEATIDIKPCSDPNAFNPNGNGVVPVGVKQTSEFDPTTEIDVSTLRFGAPDVVENGGGSMAVHDGHVEDVVPCEGDGMDDLVVHFPVDGTGFDGDEDYGRLEGETHDGTQVFGEDTVKLAGGGDGNGNGNGNGNGGS